MEKYNCSRLPKICNLLTIFVGFLALISSAQPASAASKVSKAYTNFVKTKCNAATYPQVCLKTLYPYASYVQTSHLKLCFAALDVAKQGAVNASQLVAKTAAQRGLSRMDVAALRDCRFDVKNAISELKQTVSAMRLLGDPAGRAFQWSNAKTWGSAAISDLEACRDGFTGKNVTPAVRQKIRSSLLYAERLISNALFLINRLY